jgi:hypothetical protein
MCERYAADVVTQCTEDDAEEVFDKEKSNFCDWYVIAAGRFDDGQNSTQRKAQSKLDSLFGDAEPESGTPNSASSAAEDLFK